MKQVIIPKYLLIGYALSVFSFVLMFIVPMINLSTLSVDLNFKLLELIAGKTITYLDINYELYVFSPILLIFVIVYLTVVVILTVLVNKEKIHKTLLISLGFALIILASVLQNIDFFVVNGSGFEDFYYVSGLAAQSYDFFVAFGAQMCALSTFASGVFILISSLKHK